MTLRSAMLRLLICCVASAFFTTRVILAQPPAPKPQVELTVPEEVELKTLIDAVSRQTGLKIVYDNKVATKKITIRSPGPIPLESLEALLQSALRMQGLALVDSDIAGWKTVVDAGQKQRLFEWGAGPAKPGEPVTPPNAPVVTQIVELKYSDPTQVQTAITGLLTPQGGNVIVLPQQRMLIITDFTSILTKVTGLIQLMDRPRDLGQVEFINVEHVDVTSLAEQIVGLMSARPSQAGARETSQQQNNFNVTPDTRSNRLIVIGDSDVVEIIQGLVAKLDVPLGMTTEVYTPQTLSADRLDRLIQNLLGTQRGRQVYQSAVDEEGNLLIATATTETHRKIKELLTRVDGQQSGQKRSRIRFYKLKHIDASEALETIRGIQGESTPPPVGEPGLGDGRFRVFDGQTIPGPNRPQLLPQQPLGELPPPPGYVPPLTPAEQQLALQPNGGFPMGAGANPLQLNSAPSLMLARANVTADIKTNSIIVMADADVQQIYAELIQQLDQPQPQVLIEAKVVILDTTDNFALGVEISGGDRTGAKKLFAFSSYGLSTVNPVNGALSIIPGVGFNGTLVDPDAADVVLRAFTRHKRAKVVSSPRVLVNDNATGTLSSVTEIPFTSVNASQTVSTTSFAGFAQAGTTIEVTPHISEDERLQLKYRITRNDFQGTSTTAGVPPARQTDEILSEVVIPDGHTLIVGGLNRLSENESLDSFPYLENIPVIKHLISNRTSEGRRTSLFIFLKPVILRDDKFEDLKYYSGRDVERATIPPDHPVSLPALIR